MIATVIIPTYDSIDYLKNCVESILKHNQGIADIVVVNNGKAPLETILPKDKLLKIVNTEKNLGWEGGLKEGLKHTDSEFIVFMNDDTFVPQTSSHWLINLLFPFHDKKVAAVGPTSNCVSGLQNIFHPNTPKDIVTTSYLIGFCVAVRRSALEEVGGIDDTLPGGDDFDLSMRFLKAGYKLLIQPSVMIYHHGFVTGTKVHGLPDQPMGWNSIDMIDRTNKALIQKHGFKLFLECQRQPIEGIHEMKEGDMEGDLVRSYITGEQVVELGCGFRKTIENSIGVDRIKKGDAISTLSNELSVADIEANAEEELPFETDSVDTIIARHLLEHCVDLSKTIKEWRRVLKPDGRLIIAVPDQTIGDTIPMNPEPVHAFTKSSLPSLLEMFGFHVVANVDVENFVSFVTVAEKVKKGAEIYA
jgi:SAM-dependent methyltransferase